MRDVLSHDRRHQQVGYVVSVKTFVHSVYKVFFCSVESREKPLTMLLLLRVYVKVSMAYVKERP